MKEKSKGTRAAEADIRPEYDFKGKERGKYAERFAEGSNVVVLDPDVAALFSSSESVNKALRALAEVTSMPPGGASVAEALDAAQQAADAGRFVHTRTRRRPAPARGRLAPLPRRQHSRQPVGLRVCTKGTGRLTRTLPLPDRTRDHLRRTSWTALFLAGLLVSCSPSDRSPIVSDTVLPDADPACAAPPLSDGCTSSVCTAVIRLDYLTLTLRGYSVMGGANEPTDAVAAEAIAKQFLGQKMSPECQQWCTESMEQYATAAGVHVFIVLPGDYGAFAMVSSLSGQIVAAGSIWWMGTGEWWLPSQWQPASDLKCSHPTGVTATTVHADPGVCTSGSGVTDPYSSADAADAVLKLNLASTFASNGQFSVFSYLYTPTVGFCDPNKAEFVVVLTQNRQP